ncbi:MAG: aminopeptidase 1 [Kordiimonadaceae bacterium]|jgi:aspartyl aminopeptidase|nr:aminopeptidase 1 [Kordiimonadaceae bacterium]MBT6032309.1 aminopeptidase 1 [Kordiimonadaceae bacterium]
MYLNKQIKKISAILTASLIFAGSNALLVSKVNAAECNTDMDCESSWLSLTDEQRVTVFDFAEDYKGFMDKARSELTFVTEAIKIARANGFKELKDNSPMTPGAKYYDNNRDRAVSIIVIGNEDFEQGLHVIASHIDSPRLELKNIPLYAKGEFALFQTNYHGGIKKHQWTNVPLALIGRVDKKDGTTVQINIGMNDGDPIFMIPEVSPHTDRGYGNKPVSALITAEEMDPIVAHIPGQEGDVSDQVEKYLKSTYGITRGDLVSAELLLVPAMKSRDMGFDRGLIAAYGQDDRLASYTNVRALMDIGTPTKTAIAHLVDNEEVGNVNNTGAKSQYFSNLIARLIEAKNGDDYRETQLRRTLSNSRMISIDVNPGINPMRPNAWEQTNGPRLGYGVNLKLYGRGFNANSEYIAYIRNILDENDIPWQTATYKVGTAGGGTIGGEFSRQDMNVIDFGVPVLSIHTPYAVSAKIDVYNLYRACNSFFNK